MRNASFHNFPYFCFFMFEILMANTFTITKIFPQINSQFWCLNIYFVVLIYFYFKCLLLILENKLWNIAGVEEIFVLDRHYFCTSFMLNDNISFCQRLNNHRLSWIYNIFAFQIVILFRYKLLARYSSFYFYYFQQFSPSTVLVID